MESFAVNQLAKMARSSIKWVSVKSHSKHTEKSLYWSYFWTLCAKGALCYAYVLREASWSELDLNAWVSFLIHGDWALGLPLTTAMMGGFVNEWGKSVKHAKSSVLTFHPAGAFNCTKEAQRSVTEEQV